MRSRFGLFALYLLLAGCVSDGGPDQVQIQSSVQAANAACHEAIGAKTITTHVGAARCFNQAEAPLVAAWGTNGDLLSYAFAQRVAIMERVDRRELTTAQAVAQVQLLFANVNSEAQKRNNAGRMVAAQELAATPVYTPAPYRPTYCSRFGASVTCY